jgi:hypothetical protein
MARKQNESLIISYQRLFLTKHMTHNRKFYHRLVEMRRVTRSSSDLKKITKSDELGSPSPDSVQQSPVPSLASSPPRHPVDVAAAAAAHYRLLFSKLLQLQQQPHN